MGVSAAVTMDTGMLSSAHEQTPTLTAVYQGVVYPIRLSRLFSYPAWLRNKGIIEVLLYSSCGYASRHNKVLHT